MKGLSHINLTIGDGEFVSIIGLSGAGKSTLLRSINRRTMTEGNHHQWSVCDKGREKGTPQDPAENWTHFTAF